jgi:hypothetical protein
VRPQGEGFVRNGSIGEAGGIQSRHIMPMAREAVTAAKLTLRAENVNRCRLLPEGAFGAHDLRRCRWKPPEPSTLAIAIAPTQPVRALSR